MEINQKFKLAFSKIINAKSVLVVGHISPDPDALSSISAILELLIQKNIEFRAYCEDKIDGLYSFIPHEELISSNKPQDISNFSAIVVLDCGSLSRTGLEKEIKDLLHRNRQTDKKRPYIIEFDHHEIHENSYADLEIRLPDKASTTEVLYDFFIKNKKEINKKIANSILIGLMSDTGHFIHPNSSFQALDISSKMLLKGASLKKISSYIQGSNNLLSLKVWGKIFDNLKFNEKTKFAYSVLAKEEILDFKKDQEDKNLADVFGEAVSLISYLPGVEVALLLREEEGIVKGSLRANNSDVDVSYLARLFSGGGHKRAAGFSIAGKLKKTGDSWKIIRYN